MLFELIIAMLLGIFRACEGSPTYQEEYRVNYVPRFVDSWHGPQIVAPDTPYVAAAGPKHLYFIDTRFDPETAKHIKKQIEWAAALMGPEDVIKIDEISATAEVRNVPTNETLFVFDPSYARIFFAKGINRRNPDIKLPEHESAGDCLVAHDIGTSLTKRIGSCFGHGCDTRADCER
ncbi:uncharacterized protein LY79DRAFT_552262 [Colletotrichum navitas]|uniref:Ankyrin repeat-containing protein n=1 Tax=Colletotrichum navitas TaxID=681940 RepID=A0AAD8Q0K3_9PEZI|nr:uncharacterized protein LY79DRAFT_552262 [Colletotrichum navitas]KAK1593259.1 hypothetical protein LY79DRAFT_552262 [Colletotrichum navitas]